MSEQTIRAEIGKVYKRSAEANASAYDAKTRELPVAFSSETPVQRWYGTEILSHDPADIDLSRLNNDGPLLKNHDRDQLLGTIKNGSAVCDSDKKCRMLARLSRRASVQDDIVDIEDGILSKASVGYELTREVSNTTDDQGNRTITWAWAPIEVSLVSIPADDSVGVGRAKNITESEAVKPATKEQRTMSIEIRKEDAPVVKPEAEVRAKALADASEINKLARAHNLAELGDKAIEQGQTLDQFRAVAMAEIGKRNAAGQTSTQTGELSSVIGLSKREAQRYSFFRAIMSQDPSSRVDATFERECSDAVAKKFGRQAKGIFVPYDAMVSERALTISGGSGANVVATNLLAGNFIEVLRNRMVLQNLGVTYLTGLVGDIAIPKQTVATQGAWISEQSDANDNQGTLGQITGTPRTASANVDISRKLLVQTSVDAESLVRDDIAKVIAVMIDTAAFSGAGSAAPTGLDLLGIGSPTVTAGTPTFEQMLNFWATIEASNAAFGNAAWAMPATVFAKLAATARAANYPVFIADIDSKTTLGAKTVISQSVTAKKAYLGYWDQLVVAMWGALDLRVDPFSLSKKGALRVVAFQDVDILVRHAESFASAAILA